MFRNALAVWRTSFSGLPRAVWLLALVSLVNRCGGMVMAFLTLYLKEELGFGLGAVGTITACMGVGAIAGAFAGGWLTDRLGPLRVQVASLVLNGVLLIAMLWVRGFVAMMIAVGLIGFVTEVFRPANSVAVLRASSDTDRTRSYSLVRLAFNIGWTVAPAVGGVVAYYLGWTWLFWADGLTCVAAAILLRSRAAVIFAPQGAGASLADDATNPPEPASGRVTAQPAVEAPAATRSPYRDGPFYLFWVCSFLAGMVFLPIVWSVPLYYKDVFGWSEAQIGLMAALNGAIVAVVEMPLIFRIERRWPPLRMVQLGFALYALSYAALWAFDASLALLGGLAYTVAISFGEIFVMPFSTTWTSLRATKATQGTYLALYSLSYAVANVAAPLIGAWLAAYAGYDALWVLCLGMCAAAFIGLAVLNRR